MPERERQVAPGTEGTRSFFSSFPRLFPEESFGLLTALRSQEPPFADLRAIYTSEQAVQVREYLQATRPRRNGVQPPSFYQALFAATAVEPTRAQQIRAALIYGNYHIAQKCAWSFYDSMSAKGMPVTLDDCLDEALTVGIPKAIASFPGGSARGFTAYMQTVVTHQLIGWYHHEQLYTQTPVRKAQRGEVMQSTQVLQETDPGQFASGVLFTTQRQETDPEQAACLRETLHEIETALRSRYNKPETRHYIEIFNASVQGVSANELATYYGKSAVAVQSVLRRAKRAVEHLRPVELQGAKRAQTFIKRNYATHSVIKSQSEQTSLPYHR